MPSSPEQRAAQGGWAERASQRLADAGYRRGGARSAVIALLDRQPCALTAFDIERDLRESGRAVGRASVYRVLDELVSLGLVDRVAFDVAEHDIVLRGACSGCR